MIFLFHPKHVIVYYINIFSIICYSLQSIHVIDVIKKVKNKMKQEISFECNNNYKMIIPIYKLPDDLKKRCG